MICQLPVYRTWHCTGSVWFILIVFSEYASYKAGTTGEQYTAEGYLISSVPIRKYIYSFFLHCNFAKLSVCVLYIIKTTAARLKSHSLRRLWKKTAALITLITVIMKKQLLFILLCFLCGRSIAQVEDSIKLVNAVLHYSIKGNGKKLLLLSGGPGTSANILDALYDSLSKRYQCILFEQRGTGRSKTYPMDSTTININQAAEDIIILKKHLGIDKLIIVGHSYGAMLAMYFASLHPGDIEKMVLISPGALSLDEDYANDNRRSKLSVEEILFSRQVGDSMRNNTASEATQKKMANIQFRLNIYDAFKADSILQVISKRRRNPVMENIMLADMAKNYNVRPAISHFSFPFMVVAGRQDPVAIFPTVDIMQLNKKAQIVWINKCGHMPWLEQPQIFYKEIFNFLK